MYVWRDVGVGARREETDWGLAGFILFRFRHGAGAKTDIVPSYCTALPAGLRLHPSGEMLRDVFFNYF